MSLAIVVLPLYAPGRIMVMIFYFLTKCKIQYFFGNSQKMGKDFTNTNVKNHKKLYKIRKILNKNYYYR